MIEAKHICKSFEKRNVLQHLSLDIKEGEFVAITGISGSGKSTILNILGLIESVDSGSLKIFGEKAPNPTSKEAEKLRKTAVSYLFQNYALIDNETVKKNLELVFYGKKRKERQIEMNKALDVVGLSDKLNEKIYHLSGGEQQRVALARILLKPTRLILGDEPTGSLDTENRDKVLQILRDMQKDGTTIVLVTHDPFVADFCDRVIKLT